jgi:hypothetical protein
MHRRWLLSLGVLGVVGLAGCSQNDRLGGGGTGGTGTTCTLVGCTDQLSVSVGNDDGSFPTGLQVLEVTADGVPTSCMFPLPPVQSAGSGGAVFPTCPNGLTVTLVSDETCPAADGGLGDGCAATPKTLRENITLQGAPTMVHFLQTSDGVVVFDWSFSPIYGLNEPNGPSCPPVCHQATAAWGFTLPSMNAG